VKLWSLPAVRAGLALLVIAMLPPSSVVAQARSQAPAQVRPPSPSLYQPRDVKRAFAKGTRSPDGRPGKSYWQNRARYTITLTTAPPNRRVTGTQQIVYVNASPDTLRRLAIRIPVNIHKPGAPRANGVSEEYLTSGVHVDAFSVNGQAVPWPANAGFTVQGVTLPAPLLPRDSVRLSFDWHYDLSREGNREGAIDSTTFFMAYAYPRVAVYDDYAGWDATPFDDRTEFYNDFNDYDVTVRVPANFVVWGTGTLVNAADVLQPAHLQRYQASLGAPGPITVATAAEMRARTVTAQQPMNAWRFRATNVPDVTFATSNHYVWDAGSVAVANGRPRVSVQAAYNDTAADYRHMIRFAGRAVEWFSREWPGVPYPYEKTTVVQGPAGMEYPMMANDESYADTVFSKFVAEHEIVHTYFPFYMGTNEARYAFMDEAWATAIEYILNIEHMGRERADGFFKQFRVAPWVADPSALQDLPIITENTTGNGSYGRAALGYLALKEMLGDAVFRKALHEYMDRWHGKHPIPWDFFNTFNDATGQNLDWFWQRWFFEPGHIDLALASVTRAGSRHQLVIDNVGGMPAPFDIVLRYTDGTSETVRQTSAVWKADRHRARVPVTARKRVESIALETSIWMDADASNNRWPATQPAR
jgi:hypothetical protein